MNRDFDEMIKRCCFEGSSCSPFLEDKEFVEREREINEVKIQGKEPSENSFLITTIVMECVLLETNMVERFALLRILFTREIHRIYSSYIYIYIYIIFLTNLFDLVECKRSKLVKCNNFHETCATIIIHSLPPQFIYFTLSSSTYPQCLQYRYYLHYISTSVCSLNIRDNRDLFSRNDSHIFFGDPSIQYL